MKQSVHLLTFCVILAGSPACAAEMCSFASESSGGLRTGSSTGHVLFDSSRYRVDFESEEELRGFDVLVSKDAGEHQNGIDLKNHSWYTLEPIDRAIPSAPLLGFLPSWGVKRSAKNVELSVVEKPEPEVVSGRSTRRHEIRLSYEVKIAFPGDPVHGTVHLAAVFWMAGTEVVALPALLRPEIRTGFAEIDSRLAEALANLRGVPMKQDMTISAEAKRTLARTSQTTVVLSDCKTVEAKPAQFEVPNGFKYEKPVMVGPGAPAFSGPPAQGIGR